MISLDPTARLNQVINLSWAILFERIVSKKLKINKESSLQLHLSKLIFDLGNIYCILPGEIFEIEMETNHQSKNVDIVCTLGNIKAAIELKCFMKISNRAKDLDSYDALSDIERLHNFSGFEIKKFICLTDNSYYPKTTLTGHGKTVMLKHGTVYAANKEIVPGWAGKWKVNRDKSIIFPTEILCDWISKNDWYYWKVDIV